MSASERHWPRPNTATYFVDGRLRTAYYERTLSDAEVDTVLARISRDNPEHEAYMFGMANATAFGIARRGSMIVTVGST